MNGSSVPFDTIRTNEATLSYALNPGEFIINETGYYLVNWWVAADGAKAATTIVFDLMLNGVTISQTASPVVSAQVFGTTLIEIDTIPSTLEVVNNTGDDINIPKMSIQGNITIIRISSLS